MVEFPISGVETYWWLPALVAFCISMLTSTAGVTGAFILLPFSVSILGYTSPGASPTNLLYNIVAIPSGAWRFHRDRRMLWSMAWVTGLGTVPGLVIGAVIRLKYLPDPRGFKLFAGLVLLSLGMKLVIDLVARRNQKAGLSKHHHAVENTTLTLKKLGYDFAGTTWRVPVLPIVAVSFVVGIIGGIYGIGGGAFLSPFLVAVYQLPVHSIAGAMLLGTFLTSVAGALIYILISPLIGGEVLWPDWWLGLSFGVGGAAGIYVGARVQRYVSPNVIKVILVLALLFIAVRYILGFYLN